MKNFASAVWYAIKTQENPWWEPHILVDATKDTAEVLIRERHPNLTEYAIVTEGAVRIPLVNEDPSIALVTHGWIPSYTDGCWLKPGETLPRPKDIPIPCESTIEGEEPKHGWWKVHTTFSPLKKNSEKLLPVIKHIIHFSDIYDCTPELCIFIKEIKNGNDRTMMVDQEGTYAIFEVWHVNSSQIHLRLTMLLLDEEYVHNVLLDTRSFVESLEKAYKETFVACGGWKNTPPSS